MRRKSIGSIMMMCICKSALYHFYDKVSNQLVIFCPKTLDKILFWYIIIIDNDNETEELWD
jgi:hypothetical protein